MVEHIQKHNVLMEMYLIFLQVLDDTYCSIWDTLCVYLCGHGIFYDARHTHHLIRFIDRLVSGVIVVIHLLGCSRRKVVGVVGCIIVRHFRFHLRS